jgi:hypothetical protein
MERRNHLTASILRPQVITKRGLGAADLPEQVTIALAKLASAAKEGLLALSVGVGLATRFCHNTNADANQPRTTSRCAFAPAHDDREVRDRGRNWLPDPPAMLFLLNDAGIAPFLPDNDSTSTSSSSPRPTHAC